MKKLRYQSLNSVNYKWVKIAFKKVLLKKLTIKEGFWLLELILKQIASCFNIEI